MPHTDRLEFLGHEGYNEDRNTALQMPYDDYYLLDASDNIAIIEDAVPPDTEVRGGADIQNHWKNCRAIKADVAGIVKVDYCNKVGATITEVMYLNAGIPMPVRNVIKLYRYYTEQTFGTAGSYDSTGTLKTNAIKLLR